MADHRNLIARKRDKWLASFDGWQCRSGTTHGVYLLNRLQTAYVAGYNDAQHETDLALHVMRQVAENAASSQAAMVEWMRRHA